MTPYRSQPKKAFWPSTFGRGNPLDVSSWHEPKYPIRGMRIATSGSCFAQHIGAALQANKMRYLDVEPAPPSLPADKVKEYGYDIYSARYGNVYSTRQLLQLAKRAFGTFEPADAVWEHKGGVVDAFRPTLEPEPFGSVAELETCRTRHLAAVADLFSTAELIVFTMGLTETFVSRKDGAAYPVCPGVSGGTFSDTDYEFVNLDYAEVMRDFIKFMQLVAQHNPRTHFLLTVSPVPLMATATSQNVGVATTYSKSVLRAAAGALREKFDRVDYFPSYEIITMPAMEGRFFAKDRRSVLPEGVTHVMSNFFASYGIDNSSPQQPKAAASENDRQMLEDQEAADVMCDEELLASFSK